MTNKRSREENLAKHSGKHALEARGLALIRKAVERDGRLVLRRSFEGARADACIYWPGCPQHALGLQLKTTTTVVTCSEQQGRRRSPPRRWVTFGAANKYDGLLMVLVAFVDDNPRVWMLLGSEIDTASFKINLGEQWTNHPRTFTWAQHEVASDDIAQALVTSFLFDSLAFAPADVFERPHSRTHIVEYEAQKCLETRLPLRFEAPAVENSHHDYEVDGQRWQMKVASYNEKEDSYCAMLRKSAGQHAYQAYCAEDFDWLAVCLPTRCATPVFYLIPVKELVARDLVAENLGAKPTRFRLYPHREPRIFKRHTGFAESFRVDLSTPEAAIAAYRSLVSRCSSSA